MASPRPSGRTTLASTYDALKRYDESDKTFESALKVDSLNAMVLNNYAYSLAERGEQLQRAFLMSKQSLEKDSVNASYLDTFGWIYYRMGNFSEAERYVKRAIEAGEVSAVVYEHLGDIYFRLNQPDKAKEYWSKALERDSKNSTLKEKLARGSL